ncbi:M15 family metallopeptidase [Nocardioides sp.]|uniref:M15 family metallopeptidase n=1 Tax=Nocardioides sp. TaxID=35761 RepID=UPI002631971A|nr:M15 family metallopeptidase [Nocardioides sp.]
MHRRRSRVTVGIGVLIGVVLSTTLTGCGSESKPNADGTSSASTSATGSASSSTSPTASSSVVIADPEHAVTAPGPRSGALVPADILVVSPDSLDAATVAKIKAVKGVSGVAQTSLANISVEDRLLRVMAVDPSTYRNFTPASSADNQTLWERIAGGEIALDDSLSKTVKLNDSGDITLGSEDDAPDLHVGAWAPQITGAVDAVVNTKWGTSLDMVQGNALLITTTSTAPDRVVKPLQTILGKDASVQRLDAVATYGLDIDAVQTAVVVGSVAQAVGRYTYRVGAGGTVTPDAAWVKSHIVTENVPILGAVTCNKALFPQLKAALADIVAQGLASKLVKSQYGGCYNPRFIAGTQALSNHAFGLALDVNVPGNQRGTAGQIDRSVVAVFKRWGFTWGGDWHYTDPMHFEMNRVVHPG